MCIADISSYLQMWQDVKHKAHGHNINGMFQLPLTYRKKTTITNPAKKRKRAVPFHFN